KTRLCSQLAVALAQGPPADFLGRNIAKQGRVLYLDFESQPADIPYRMTKVAGPDGIEHGDRIFVYAINTLADSELALFGEGFKKLFAIVDEAKPDCVIIDTWRLLFQGKENDSQDNVRHLRALAAIRKHNPKLAIVIVHHTRKEDPTFSISLRS